MKRHIDSEESSGDDRELRTNERREILRKQFLKIEGTGRTMLRAYKLALKDGDTEFAQEQKAAIFKFCSDFYITMASRGFMIYRDSKTGPTDNFTGDVCAWFALTFEITDKEAIKELVLYVMNAYDTATPYDVTVVNKKFGINIYTFRN